MTAFLGIEKSATGRKWVGLGLETDRQAHLIAQQTGLEAPVARTLARLGVDSAHAMTYLSPSLRELMPDPSVLLDMDKAATRLAQAVQQNQKIALFTDYDVDGATSGALLHSWLSDLGLDATIYIPDRIDEGYGPNDEAMQMLADSHDLILCLDCGTLSHGPIAHVKGTDVIVLDHHMGGETLPDAFAVVNPNRQDETGDYGYLCAAGVVFLVLVAVNRIRRTANLPCPDLLSLLDLVALGTVADVAPLQGLNRAFVRQGLSVMTQRKRIGMAALADVAGLKSAPTSYSLGFLLGPRINAGGRIGKADLGARLLTTSDPDEAQAIADKLHMLNDERREIEADVQLKAIAQAEERGYDAPLAWAAGNGWHPGVVGIVASRMKEASNRPSIVIGIDGDEAKGSGRSVTGIDLGAAIATLTHEGLLLKGGGHKMAAGLTVATDKIEAAMARLSELLARQGANKMGVKDLRLDGAITPSGITTALIEQLETCGPFGAGAPAPRFALPSVRIAFAKRAGENHLRLTLTDDSGGRIDAIAFRAFDTPLGELLQDHKGRSFHVAGRLEIDDWGGRRRAKLRLEDAALVETN